MVAIVAMSRKRNVQGQVWADLAELWDAEVERAADAGLAKGDVLAAALRLWLGLSPDQKVGAIQALNADIQARLRQAFAGPLDEQPTEADRAAAAELLDAAQARQQGRRETKSGRRKAQS